MALTTLNNGSSASDALNCLKDALATLLQVLQQVHMRGMAMVGEGINDSQRWQQRFRCFELSEGCPCYHLISTRLAGKDVVILLLLRNSRCVRCSRRIVAA